MNDCHWRRLRLEEAVARPEVVERAQSALDAAALCDACLGRVFAAVGTGLENATRGRAVRQAAGAGPPGETCGVCGGLFDALGAWIEKARTALAGWEFDTFLVASRVDPRIEAREAALWEAVGGELAEPYKQHFNRAVGARLCDVTGAEPDFARPDVRVVTHHATGEVTLDVRPLYVAGRYRKLVRGIPQCRWAAWPTSVQDLIGDPVREAADGEDHVFHGCGREDVDVRCLGERPFVLEVTRPRRRRLDFDALAETVNRSGQVKAVSLARCGGAEVARLKGLRPEKTYRALVRLGGPVEESDLARLAGLVGPVRQRTPTRVMRRRSDRQRRRHVRSLDWRRLGPDTLELTLRTEAGLYVKELVSGNGGRTTPSVAEVLGAAAECAELDVLAVHLDQPSRGTS